jgi:hypothetical protein
MSDFKYECNLHSWGSWTKPCFHCQELQILVDNHIAQSTFKNDIVVATGVDYTHPLDIVPVVNDVEIEAEIITMSEELTTMSESIYTVTSEADLLRERLAIAEEVIKFYADYKNWRNLRGYMSNYGTKAVRIAIQDVEERDHRIIGGKMASDYVKEYINSGVIQ